MRCFGPEDFRRHPDSYFRPASRPAGRLTTLRRPTEEDAGKKVTVVLVWSVLGVGLVLCLLVLIGTIPGGRHGLVKAGSAPAAESRPVVTVAAARKAPAGWGLALPFLHLQVSVRFEAPKPAVRVPAAAVLHRLGQTQVAVVDRDGALRYRTVRLGPSHGREVEVVAGLNGDETVVVDMPAGLRDGAVVRQTPATGSGGRETES
jgi:hypothetical protein